MIVPPALADVGCIGNESNLMECNRTFVPAENFEEFIGMGLAAVRCEGKYYISQGKNRYYNNTVYWEISQVCIRIGMGGLGMSTNTSEEAST